ncbi:TOBE domain-containing protein [Methanobacterium sp. ACI-7]|uniref:TOBE domain-containing protein n=1 Tax=unclassified Methanobacterium TaxID=2627676 RepID=UPI0039C1BA2E
MKISARNVLKGKIENVDKGPVSSTIKIKLESPDTVTASITKEAVEELGLKEGEEVYAIIKASEVMVAKK